MVETSSPHLDLRVNETIKNFLYLQARIRYQIYFSSITVSTDNVTGREATRYKQQIFR